jgi:hypothetical protein
LNHEGHEEREERLFVFFVNFAAFVVLWLVGGLTFAAQNAGRDYLPYSDAKPIFDALRPDLVPADFRDKTAAEREASWPAWTARRDAEIRARVAAGDEDSIVNYLLHGTTFTRRPRPSDRELAGLVATPGASAAWLDARLDDLVAALAAPALRDERLQFARDVLARHGVNPSMAEGRNAAKQYLEQRTREMSAAGALRTRSVLDASSADLADRLTVFRDRGLSSDTSIFIDYAIDATLAAMKAQHAFGTAPVRRVAIIGPGLDFSDKLDGYDFYPPQTIQPFAVIDSLVRLGLSSASDVRITAFDISQRILDHLDGARARARAGQTYRVVVPRNVEQSWSAPLVTYWRRFGDRVGTAGPAITPPPNAGRADVRTVLVRPAAVLSIDTRNLNIVLQRPEPGAGEEFDLVIATNILLYYDVFEQSLAGVNIARMLRPGGFLLTNDRIFELPTTPLAGTGFTDVGYFTLPGIGNTGARVIWYQRQ